MIIKLPDAVPTGAVPTGAVPTDAVPTAKGRYDKYQEAYPEMVKLRLKAGTTALLKAKAKELGFGSMSKLIRSALKYALSHDDFKSD